MKRGVHANSHMGNTGLVSKHMDLLIVGVVHSCGSENLATAQKRAGSKRRVNVSGGMSVKQLAAISVEVLRLGCMCRGRQKDDRCTNIRHTLKRLE